VIVQRIQVPLLLLDKGPDFINLNPTTREVPHFLVYKVVASLSHRNHEAHNGIAVRVGHTLSGADGVALH